MYVLAKSNTKQCIKTSIERGRRHAKRCLPLFLFAWLLLLYSCQKDAKREYPWGTGDETYIDEDTTVFTLEETGGDTLLVGSAPYHDAAERAERMHNELQAVKSPDMLLSAMADYEIYIKVSTDDVSLPQEKERLSALRQEVDNAYSQACRDYMLPARGVLETIQLVHQRIDNCTSSAEFNRLKDVRFGYFQNLPQIHKIVLEPNKRRTVRQKAMELQRLFNSKQAEYSK